MGIPLDIFVLISQILRVECAILDALKLFSVWYTFATFFLNILALWDVGLGGVPVQAVAIVYSVSTIS